MLLALALVCLTLPLWPPIRDTRAQQRSRDIKLSQTGSPEGGETKRIALVIGNGEYRNATRLKNPPNDANDISAALKQLGFEVTSASNIGQREMKRLIREFGQRLRNGGQGLFYFAGHGVQSGGRNFLIPVDADIQNEADVEDLGVDVNLVLNLMDEAGNGLNIVILDACRNNPFARSFRSATNGLAQLDAPTGTLIAYATAPGRVASDGAGRNGLYTEALLTHMRVPGLSAIDMFQEVRAQVVRETGGVQVPWEATSLVGKFYFAGERAAPLTRPAATAEPIDAAAVEREFWEGIKESNDAEDFRAYLKAYPNGANAPPARERLRKLEAARPSPNSSAAADTSMSTAHAKLSAGALAKNQMGMSFVYVPAGSFMMGEAKRGGREDEMPAHEVTIGEGFFIGQYEVTLAEWQAVMGQDARVSTLCGTDPRCPAGGVSWNNAQEFIRRLNAMNDGFTYRLPSEAEWEYACRAGTDGFYAGDLNSMAWYSDNSDNKPHTVGKKRANAWGLYDMHGNVWEWCEDVYHKNYDGAPSDGSAWLGAGDLSRRVVRGGSSKSTRGAYGDLRSASRQHSFWSSYGYLNDYALGFRVVAVAQR